MLKLLSIRIIQQCCKEYLKKKFLDLNKEKKKEKSKDLNYDLDTLISCHKYDKNYK
jgi:NADH:ubiquinone oxidoreductase subunit D